MPDPEEMCPSRTSLSRIGLSPHQLQEQAGTQSTSSAFKALDTLVRLEHIVESVLRVSSARQRLEVILHAALRAVPAAEQGTLYLRPTDSQTLIIGAVSSSSAELVGSEVQGHGGYIDAVARVQHPTIIDDAHCEDLAPYGGRACVSKPVRSALIAPFVIGGRTVGILALENCGRASAFAQEDLKFVSLLARHTALAVDNACLPGGTSPGYLSHHPSQDAWLDIAERLPLGLLFAVPHRQYVWTNSALCEMTGHSRGELANWETISSVFRQDLANLCNEDNSMSSQRALLCRDGTERQAEIAFWGTASVSSPGRRTYFGIVQDRSKDEDLERKLFHMQRLSEMGSLLSAISHELNNPLTAVIGFAELILMRDDLPLEAREDLETVLQQAERSVCVVRDLLDYVRTERENPTPLDINHLIRQLVRFRARTLRKNGLKIRLELADGLPRLLGNPRQLQQVLLNLIDNAEQATSTANGEAQVWIRTSLANRKRSVHIAVRDNGPGVPVELESSVFQPFFTTKKAGEGTGLGLSISKQIVERHRGEIWLENKPGEGAAFIIDLPVPATCREAQAAPSAVTAQAAGVPARILVVDDEKSISHLLAKVLAKLGHQVDVAWSGRKAIQKLAEDVYDIVFLDLKIPGLSGQGVYAWIKKDCPDLVKRTVILTGDTLGSETTTFLEREQALHLLKPFQLADLRRVMGEIWPS